jgi:hypothetical protein
MQKLLQPFLAKATWKMAWRFQVLQKQGKKIKIKEK